MTSISNSNNVNNHLQNNPSTTINNSNTRQTRQQHLTIDIWKKIILEHLAPSGDFQTIENFFDAHYPDPGKKGKCTEEIIILEKELLCESEAFITEYEEIFGVINKITNAKNQNNQPILPSAFFEWMTKESSWTDAYINKEKIKNGSNFRGLDSVVLLRGKNYHDYMKIKKIYDELKPFKFWTLKTTNLLSFESRTSLRSGLPCKWESIYEANYMLYNSINYFPLQTNSTKSLNVDSIARDCQLTDAEHFTLAKLAATSGHLAFSSFKKDEILQLAFIAARNGLYRTNSNFKGEVALNLEITNIKNSPLWQWPKGKKEDSRRQFITVFPYPNISLLKPLETNQQKLKLTNALIKHGVKILRHELENFLFTNDMFFETAKNYALHSKIVVDERTDKIIGNERGCHPWYINNYELSQEQIYAIAQITFSVLPRYTATFFDFFNLDSGNAFRLAKELFIEKNMDTKYLACFNLNSEQNMEILGALVAKKAPISPSMFDECESYQIPKKPNSTTLPHLVRVGVTYKQLNISADNLKDLADLLFENGYLNLIKVPILYSSYNEEKFVSLIKKSMSENPAEAKRMYFEVEGNYSELGNPLLLEIISKNKIEEELRPFIENHLKEIREKAHLNINSLIVPGTTEIKIRDLSYPIEKEWSLINKIAEHLNIGILDIQYADNGYSTRRYYGYLIKSAIVDMNSSLVPKENERFKLAEWITVNRDYKNPGSNAYDISKHIHKYKLTKEHSFKIAQMIARNGEDSISQYIDNYSLTYEQKNQIFELLIQSPQASPFKYIDYFKFNPNDVSRLKLYEENFNSLKLDLSRNRLMDMDTNDSTTDENTYVVQINVPVPPSEQNIDHVMKKQKIANEDPINSIELFDDLDAENQNAIVNNNTQTRREINQRNPTNVLTETININK